MLHLVFDVNFFTIHLSWCWTVLKLIFTIAFGSIFKIIRRFSFGINFWVFWVFFSVELFTLLEAIFDDGTALLMGFFVDFLDMFEILFVFLYFFLDVAFLKLLGLFGFKGELLEFHFSFSLKIFFHLLNSFSFLGFLVFFLEQILDLILKNRGDFFLLLIMEVVFIIKLDEFVVFLDFLSIILGHGLE